MSNDEGSYMKKFPLWTDFNYIVLGGKSTATYYPGGSALLPGDKLTFNSYVRYFGNDIDPAELTKIKGYNKETEKQAKKDLDEKQNEYAWLLTFYSLVNKIFLTTIIMMIFTLPVLIYIQLGGIENINLGVTVLYYLILVLIFFISLLVTLKLTKKIITLQKILDVRTLNIREILNPK